MSLPPSWLLMIILISLQPWIDRFGVRTCWYTEKTRAENVTIRLPHLK